MIRNRIIYFILFLLGVLIFVLTNTYHTLLLLLVIIVLPVLSFSLLFLSKGGLKIQVDLPISMERGGETVFYCHLTNGSFFPIARVVMEISWLNQLTYSSGSQRIRASIGGKQSERLILEINSPACGATLFSVDKIRVLDVLGLFAFKVSPPGDKATVVYPSLSSVETGIDKSVETLGEGVKYSTEKSGFDVSEIFSLKEYVPGDEVRKIHWKLSSKLDKPIVREFSLPLNYSVFLLIELVRDEEPLMNKSVETFFSLSRSLLEEGINHNIAWYDGGESLFHVRGLDTFEDLEYVMADLLTSFSYEEPTLAVEHYILENYISPHSTLIYITSKPNPEKMHEIRMVQPVQLMEIKGEDR
ncbi:MAG: DUF58 domain-containing protein [Anaerovoracaceae bacterium]|jgi:uncharacterized protein (DUF58 family)